MKNFKISKTVYCWVLICTIVIVMLGCASSKKYEPSAPTIPPQNIVKSIDVEDSDVGKKIIIEGATPLPYTFFRLIPQPLTLVVDIPQTTLSPEATDPIQIGDGVIQEIEAVQRDSNIEVAIALNKLVNYQVQKRENFLYIDVGKQSPLLAMEEEKKSEIEIVKEVRSPVSEEVITKALPPAQNLVDVAVDTSEKESIILHLKADGTLGDYNTFDLRQPTRLVVDLWKVKRKFGKKEVSVDSAYLKKVRLGDHPQKVRVVLDIPTKTLPSHRIDRIGNSLVIVLGEKEIVAQKALKEPEDVAMEEEKASPLIPVPVTGEVIGIDFKQLEDKSRIIISTSAKVPYEVKKGSENTVQVEVKGVTVPLKLTRPLDTHEFASPVSMITPNNVMVGSQKSAQILVKLRKMVAFDVNQENDKIYVDFERTEEFKVEQQKSIEVVTVQKTPPAEEVTEKPAEDTTPTEAIKKEELTPPSPKAEEVPPSEQVAEKVYTGKKITLDFKDADIDNIIRLFAEVSDLNIITTEEVKGTVTVRLVDVPWDQALDIVLDAKNLGMEKTGNVIRIAPYEKIQKDREAKARALKAQEELAPFVTELIPVNYSEAEDLASQVKDLLSEGGSITVDERTNTLIIKDTQIKVDKAKELVRRLDTQTPQVLIQAQIIEASTDFSRELGIQWGGRWGGGKEGEKHDIVLGGAGGLETLNADDLVVDLPAGVGTGAGGAIEFAITNLKNLGYLKAQISAMEEKGQGRIISSPRITTLDHKEASIEQGLRVPYPASVSEEGELGYEFIEANLKLTVTPHVTGDGFVRMEIVVKKDSPDFSKTVGVGVPSIDKKEAKTEVLVKNGEVVVIGGIYTQEQSGPTIAGVPWLYKIPLLGWLFHKRSKTENKRELLIFITPSIQPRRIITS
jgi:type IV pilus assembly protein PilQ